MARKPELFDRNYLETLIKTLHQDCMNSDCNHCNHWGELDENEETCMSDVIMELWRRLYNTEADLKELQGDAQ